MDTETACSAKTFSAFPLRCLRKGHNFQLSQPEFKKTNKQKKTPNFPSFFGLKILSGKSYTKDVE